MTGEAKVLAVHQKQPLVVGAAEVAQAQGRGRCWGVGGDHQALVLLSRLTKQLA
jgi:hypothetical protein